MRYNGQYYDEETGMYYLRARYYDPQIRRFISEDPIKDGVNWYAYCGNNPIMRFDSNGLSWSEYDAFLPQDVQDTIKIYTNNYNKAFSYDTIINEAGDEVNARDYWHSKAFNVRTKYIDSKYLNYANKDFKTFNINTNNFTGYFGVDNTYTYDQILYTYAMWLQNDPATKHMRRDENGSLNKDWIKAVKAFGGLNRLSGKEKANDIPSWARGKKPQQGESGKNFAKRLMDEKYGSGNYGTGLASEYNKIKKWGDRGFGR